MNALKHIIFAVVAWSCVGSLIAADAKSEKINAILDAGVGQSTKDLQAAQQIYQSAQASGLIDIRHTYALALVSMQHRKYAEAHNLLVSSRDSSQALWPIRRASLWLHVASKQPKEALLDVQAIVKHLPAEASQVTTDQRGTARMLGAASSHLSQWNGDASEAGSALQKSLSELKLCEPLAKEYQQGAEDSQKITDAVKIEIVALRSDLDAKLRAKLQPQISETEAKLKKIDTQANPLLVERQKIKDQFASIEQQITSLESERRAKEAKEQASEDKREERSNGKREAREINIKRSDEQVALESQVAKPREQIRMLEEQLQPLSTARQQVTRMGTKPIEDMQKLDNGTYIFPAVRALEDKKKSWANHSPFPFDAEITRLRETAK